MNAELTDRIISSSVWAAYGDAIGFISELTDAKGLIRRLGGASRQWDPEMRMPWAHAPLNEWPLQETVAWRRRIGGRQGTFAQLPAGSYSDDTQLRLATSRALSANRGFDIEAFARIELPVFAAYSLGAGKATKQAAANLAKPRSSWLVNSYPGWTDAGGNGVLVRIQPHAWAAVANEQSPAQLMLDVLKNGLCTHGHPRALLSSCAYAMLLARALARRERPLELQDIREAAQYASRVIDVIPSDQELVRYIIPAWEEYSGTSFTSAWQKTADELLAEIHILAEAIPADAAELPESAKVGAYLKLLNRLNMLSPERRGSGIGTLIAAISLCILFPDDPHSAIRLAVGVIGSDTDSIATVAAGILGCSSPLSSLPGPLLDKGYIRDEARRVASLRGAPESDFSYPDILFWTPPRTQADAVMSSGGRIFVSGLGYAVPQSELFDSPSQFSWQWLRLHTGQSVLAKRRQDITEVPTGELFHFLPTGPMGAKGVDEEVVEHQERGDSAIAARLEKAAAMRTRTSKNRSATFRQDPLLPDSELEKKSTSNPDPSLRVLTIESAVNEARASKYDSAVLGGLLIDFSLNASPDLAIAFAAIVSREIQRELGSKRSTSDY